MTRNIHGTLIFTGLIFVAVSFLFGCAPVNVLGSCPIPEALDYRAVGPAPPTAKNLKAHFVEEARQRHANKVLTDDFNALHDYVKDQCK